jgi:hypothetical protein
VNDEALAHWGLLRQKQKTYYCPKMAIYTHLSGGLEKKQGNFQSA